MRNDTIIIPEFGPKQYSAARRALTPWGGPERWALVLGTAMLEIPVAAGFLLGTVASIPVVWRFAGGVAALSCVGAAFSFGRAINSMSVERALRSAGCDHLDQYWHRAVLAAYGSREKARVLLPFHADAQARRAAHERGQQWRPPPLALRAFGIIAPALFAKVAQQSIPLLFFYSLLFISGSFLVAGVAALVRGVLDAKYREPAALAGLLRECAKRIQYEDALMELSKGPDSLAPPP